MAFLSLLLAIATQVNRSLYTFQYLGAHIYYSLNELNLCQDVNVGIKTYYIIMIHNIVVFKFIKITFSILHMTVHRKKILILIQTPMLYKCLWLTI